MNNLLNETALSDEAAFEEESADEESPVEEGSPAEEEEEEEDEDLEIDREKFRNLLAKYGQETPESSDIEQSDDEVPRVVIICYIVILCYHQPSKAISSNRYWI